MPSLVRFSPTCGISRSLPMVLLIRLDGRQSGQNSISGVTSGLPVNHPELGDRGFRSLKSWINDWAIKHGTHLFILGARAPILRQLYEMPGTAFVGRYDGFLLRMIKLLIHKARAVPPAFVAERREN